jgi:UDP-2,3-diacylglucosamine pyrophosphatase LpxH
MRLAFLSDLHLAPPASNRCTTPPEALVGLIERLRADHDEVVALGDLYDLSRPAAPLGWSMQHDAVRAAWPRVTSALEGCARVFGNHDAWLGNVGVPEERAWTTGAGLVLARHGHQWDGGLKRVPGLAGAANFVAGWGHRAGVAGLDAALHGAHVIADRLVRQVSARAQVQDRTRAGALALLGRGEAEVLVVGHSHRLGLAVEQGRLLIETGSHCHGYEDWAELDTEAGAATLWRDGEVFGSARRVGGVWALQDGDPRIGV